MEMKGDPADVAFFEESINAHLPKMFVRVMRRLPRDPRCRLCRAPFGGMGGRIMHRVGFGPSRKNPTLCNTCFEKAPMGGVEMEIGVLFADVRGYTAMSERMAPGGVAELMNRFYSCATDVLMRSAVIDKLVGDQVMAMYLPGLLTDEWEDDLLRDATDLLAAVGCAADSEPWLDVGVGIDVGHAYVGNVGSGEVKDFTALGDVVNTAARLQSAAGPGEVVVSERLCERLANVPTTAVAKTLALKGKSEPERVRVVDARMAVA